MLGDEFVMPAFVNPEVPTEGKTFPTYITNQPMEDVSEKLATTLCLSLSPNCDCGAFILTNEND